MSNTGNQDSSSGNAPRRAMDIVNKGLAKRYAAERRFRLYGLAAIILSLMFLSLLFISIIGNGYTAFQQTYLELDVHFDANELPKDNLGKADYQGLVKASLLGMFPEVKGRKDKRMLYALVSSGASFKLRNMVMKSPDLIGQTRSIWVPADDDVDMFVKGHFDRNVPEDERRLKDKQLAWLDQLTAVGKVKKTIQHNVFHRRRFPGAGVGGEFGARPWDRFSPFLSPYCCLFPSVWPRPSIWRNLPQRTGGPTSSRVNINNLAAVPSIVFGLLGLAVFLNFFGMPRSAPPGRWIGTHAHDAPHYYYCQSRILEISAPVPFAKRLLAWAHPEHKWSAITCCLSLYREC